jgi:hypothetical protein
MANKVINTVSHKLNNSSININHKNISLSFILFSKFSSSETELFKCGLSIWNSFTLFWGKLKHGHPGPNYKY